MSLGTVSPEIPLPEENGYLILVTIMLDSVEENKSKAEKNYYYMKIN